MSQEPAESNFFKDKKVLITGNTGFKGYWLEIFLLQLGAEVYGVSLGSNKNSNLKANKIKKQYYLDIVDFNILKTVFNEVKPDLVYHLAANAITLNSYEKPLETFQTTTMGTINLLEVLRLYDKKCDAIIITSDKCYENKEWIWGYRENDRLGGKDPYSASKTMCEIAVKSYFESFFSKTQQIKIATCRAGNVIGGNDWGEKRIVPDTIRAWNNKVSLKIRNPESIRPWNYVLDIIYGYLSVACNLEQKQVNGESFNFGPGQASFISVRALTKLMWEFWPERDFEPFLIESDGEGPLEHKLLKLYSDKSFNLLKWKPKIITDKSLMETVEWYIHYNRKGESVQIYSENLVKNYLNLSAQES